MNSLVRLWERPPSAKYMIAGWHQWADAGEVSSGLPRYLISETDARKIGEMQPSGFYLFQIPATHHLLRPTIRLKDGYREELQERRNEFFFSGDDSKGFLIFLGEEPHQNEEEYAGAFLDAVEELGVKRVAVVAGVHGPVPYDRDREISCIYSIPGMKDELSRYAVRFSDYEGGATIGVILADRAEARGLEFIVFYAIAPSYNFSQSSLIARQMTMEEDFKAWYDLMRRLNHMFDLALDLSDLEERSQQLLAIWDHKISELASLPQLDVNDYLEKISREFTERTFGPLGDIWEDALGDLFEDSET